MPSIANIFLHESMVKTVQLSEAWGFTGIQQLQLPNLNNHLGSCLGSSAANTKAALLPASGEGLRAQREPCWGVRLPL